MIERWSPIFLSGILKQWCWRADTPAISAQKVWHDFCCYLYLPRLKDEQVFSDAITAGSGAVSISERLKAWRVRITAGALSFGMRTPGSRLIVPCC